MKWILGGMLVLVFIGVIWVRDGRTVPKVGIALVPVGQVDRNVLEMLAKALGGGFKNKVGIVHGLPEPDYAFNRDRDQYLSTAILRALVGHQLYGQCERMLGIVDHDLFVPDLNFVFGEAGGKAAVISLSRLRQEFYGLPEDKDLFYRRVLTEAVHELGHTYGLGHCSNPRCVMFFSNSLIDTDKKGPGFCSICDDRLR